MDVCVLLCGAAGQGTGQRDDRCRANQQIHHAVHDARDRGHDVSDSTEVLLETGDDQIGKPAGQISLQFDRAFADFHSAHVIVIEPGQCIRREHKPEHHRRAAAPESTLAADCCAKQAVADAKAEFVTQRQTQIAHDLGIDRYVTASRRWPHTFFQQVVVRQLLRPRQAHGRAGFLACVAFPGQRPINRNTVDFH